MSRLSIARRIVPFTRPSQVAISAPAFRTRSSVSESFAADLIFVTSPKQSKVSALKSQVEPLSPIRLEVHIRPASVAAPLRAAKPALIGLTLGAVSILAHLAVFIPYFRVEGKNYSLPEQDPRLNAEVTRAKATRSARERSARPSGISISKWDALWPLLQPPLNFAFPELLDFPSELRPYQIDGVKFLVDSENALLGDDMGTGKTVQAVVALRILLQKGRISRALIISPLAVLPSWEEHISNWGRVFRCVTVRGNKAERSLLWKTPAHAYLTTYETVREDSDLLTELRDELELDLVIADEVQKIKNPGAATTKAIRALKAARRWGLSATPFENRPQELVSVFSFIKPGILSYDGETPQSIRHKIAPFFLRRTKELLRDELPEKVHDVVWLELGQNQRRAYDLAEQQGIVELEKQGEKVTVSHVLALLQKLKQICNFDPKTWDSAKLDALRERLDEVAERNSKALVFTQFIEFGINRIKSVLKPEDVVEYSGSLRDSERQRALNRLKTDERCKVMICTQAAAGLGLNLTAANYVFHFDHWWNPARTAQAEDRVHRIGQKKTVFVYHLWVKRSVEERIFNILQRKRAQFEEIIGPMSNAEGTGLSEDELFEIFGLKKTSRTRPPHSVVAVEPQATETVVQDESFSDVPDVEVWPLIRKTELALRKCVREILNERYGAASHERVLLHLGDEESVKINQRIDQYRRKYSASSAEFSASEDPLDYTYLQQMMSIISREWPLFKPVFGDRGYVNAKVNEIATVRNDEAHFRGIPPVEKMRAYVACADLLARLQRARAETRS